MDSPLSKKYLFCLLPWKPFKNDGKCFLFHLKSSFCSQDIWICVFFDHVEKTAWLGRSVQFQNLWRHNLINNYNTHIAQYLTKQRQLDNEIGSVNRIWEIFFFKSHAENKSGILVPGLFLLFKKALFEVKASGLQLSFKKFQ